jgi:hypothetical protein
MERTKTAPPLTTNPVIADLARPTMEGPAPILAKPPSGGSLAKARETVLDFLLNEFQTREIRITKITRSPDRGAGWYAEAEILVPNLSIKTLGLPLSQEVLEKQFCVVEIDSDMTVTSYEVVDPHDR